jgi:hypothetical protein
MHLSEFGRNPHTDEVVYRAQHIPFGMVSILVRPFPRRSTGRFDDLSVRKPITITASAPRRPLLRLGARTLSCFPAWRQVSVPCALGIVGLALAVVLWGYGYKLSLYHRDAASSARIPVAKLWLGPRGASVAAASGLKPISHLAPGSQAFCVCTQRPPNLSRAIGCILPLCERRVVFLDLLIPSRAPPPLLFLFA